MSSGVRRSIASTTLGLAALFSALPAAAQSPQPPASPAEGDLATPPVLVCPVPGDPDAPVASGGYPVEDVAAAPATRPVGRWRGTWTRMAAAPIAPRFGAATDVAFSGERMIVWSGYGGDGELLWDGASYDPRRDRWYELPDVPLAPRTGFAFEAGETGSFFLWGGVARDGTPMSDGAYVWARRDRRSGTPRVSLTPEAPLTAGPAMAAGDLNNWLFVVTPGESPADPPRFAYLAGPDEGWRGPTIPPTPEELPIDAPPHPAGVGYEITDDSTLLSYQADGTVIASGWDVLDGWSDPVAVRLPATGGTCPALDRGSAWIRTDGTTTPVGLVRRDGWRLTAEPPRAALRGGMLVTSPTRLILADALLAYDITAERWLRLPPLPGGARTGVSALWAYGRLHVWGGRTGDGRLPVAGWIFTPALPADTVRLPGGGRRTGDCGGEGIDQGIRLQADRSDPDLVWFMGREGRYSASWPDGFAVRFGQRAVVLDPEGRVVAREGERLRDLAIEPFCTSSRSVMF